MFSYRYLYLHASVAVAGFAGKETVAGDERLRVGYCIFIYFYFYFFFYIIFLLTFAVLTFFFTFRLYANRFGGDPKNLLFSPTPPTVRRRTRCATIIHDVA